MATRHALPLSALLLVPTLLLAQKPASVRITARPSLLAQATVTSDSAQRIALARVANGTIAEGELEVEHHRLIWSFDVKVAGRPGITEVNVDAKTGAIVAVSHEGPADEARENAQEKREHPKAKGTPDHQ